MSRLAGLRDRGQAIFNAWTATRCESAYRRAFCEFYAASTPDARAAQLRPFMVLLDYDAWLAGSIRQAWERGNVDFAERAQQCRFVLRYAAEVGPNQALEELDLDPSPEWRARIDPVLDALGDRRDPASLAAFASELEDLLCDPEGLSPYQRIELIRLVAGSYAERWRTGDGTELIDAALALLDEAVQTCPPLDCLRSLLYGAAAMLHNMRFKVTQSLRSIDLTLHCAELAISAALAGQLELADFHGIWAAGLRKAPR